MQIHRDQVITPSCLEHIGHELGGDRSPTLIFLVLARVGEVGQDGGDAAGGGGAAGVDEDEQFHYVVVDVAGFGGLDDEDWVLQLALVEGWFEREDNVPSSSRTDSPMDMLLSLLEY